MNKQEMKEILDKPFLTNADIKKLMNCSPSKASRIRSAVEDSLVAQGKRLITNDIPTRLFVEIMNLEVSLYDSAN